MRKKLIAFLTALTVCISMSAVMVSADTEETESISETETSVSETGETEDDTDESSTEKQAESESKNKKQNQNLSADYAETSIAPLFDDSKVHTVNLVIDDDDWKRITENTDKQEYIECDAEIDGELLKDVSIRLTGNTNKAYHTHCSIEIEFDRNNSKTVYHGLDKLVLNNLGQDITCQKDFLVYHMMNDMGVKSPLSSYTVLQKNGEDFGLYLAVEAIEDSFAVRNYGTEDVSLYLPDVTDEISFNDYFNLPDLFTIMSGKQYHGKTADERVNVFADYWSALYDNYAVPYMHQTGNAEDYELFFSNSALECTEEDRQVFMDSLDKLNHGADTAEKLSVLNTDQLMRYLAVHSFVCNNDSITGILAHNFCLAEEDGKFSYVPWNYSEAFGGLEFETAITYVCGDVILDMTPERLNNFMPLAKNLINYPIDEPTVHGTSADIPMLGTWLNDEAGLAEYHKLYNEFIKKAENGDYEKLSDSVHDMLLPYIKQGLAFCQEDEFETAAKQVKLFLKYRTEAVKGQLDGSIPTTKEGQTKRAETLIEPEGLDVSLMRDKISMIDEIPPAPYLNQLIAAFLGNDTDNSIGHFSDLILEYWENPQTMYSRVPELMQVPALRNGARNIITKKYNSFSLFAVKGAEIQPNLKETAAEEMDSENKTEAETDTAEATEETADFETEIEETAKEGEEE